jgi:protein TonB
MDRTFREELASGSKAVWLGALLASLAIHFSLMALAVSWKAPLPAKPRRVVSVEPITLTKGLPGPTGGGGLPAPAPSTVSPKPKPAPKPAAPPKPKPKVHSPAKPKPKPIKQVKKTIEKEVAEPPPSLALPTPASPAPSKASGRTTASLGRSTGPARGQVGTRHGSGKGSDGPGSGVGRGPGSGAGSGGGSLLGGYLREVRRLLERQKGYPPMAQRLNIQGVVLVHFTIAADGSIQSTRLRRSSGHEVLDDAARKTVEKVGQFPPLPRALGREKLAVEIPLAFRLRD